MRIFNKTKHEMYEKVAEGITLEYKYYNELGAQARLPLDISNTMLNDTPLLLEYVADNLVKKGCFNMAETIYKRVNTKKANIINELFTNNPNTKQDFETQSPVNCYPPLGKAIDSLLEEYQKKHEQNYEITFIPPIM